MNLKLISNPTVFAKGISVRGGDFGIVTGSPKTKYENAGAVATFADRSLKALDAAKALNATDGTVAQPPPA